MNQFQSNLDAKINEIRAGLRQEEINKVIEPIRRQLYEQQHFPPHSAAIEVIEEVPIRQEPQQNLPNEQQAQILAAIQAPKYIQYQDGTTGANSSNILLMPFSNQIDSLMKNFKLQDPLREILNSVLLSEQPIKVITDEINGSLRKKLQAELHMLLEKVSAHKIQQKMTTKQLEIKNLCKEYELDQKLLVLQEEVMKRQIKDKQKENVFIFLQRLFKIRKAFESEQQPKTLEQRFKQICITANLTTEQDYQECLAHLKQNKIQQLENYPGKKFRKDFSNSIHQLLRQFRQKQKKVDMKSLLRDILVRAEINSQQQIQQSIQLFQKGLIQQLKEYPKKPLRQKFAQQIESLLIIKKRQGSQPIQKAQTKENIQQIQDPIIKKASVNQVRIMQQQEQKKRIQDILTQCKLDQINHHQYIRKLENGQFTFIKNMPSATRKLFLSFVLNQYKPRNSSLQTLLYLHLTPLTSDRVINSIINNLKTQKQAQEGLQLTYQLQKIIQNLLPNFQIVVNFVFPSKKKRKYCFSELYAQAKPNYISKAINQETSLQIDEFVVFMNERLIDVEKMDFRVRNEYTLNVLQKRQVSVKYGERIIKLMLVYEESLDFNKQNILLGLKQKKLFLPNQTSFLDQHLRTKLEINKKVINSVQQSKSLQCLEQLYDKNLVVMVQVDLSIVLYFQDRKEEHIVSSSTKVCEFKKTITSKFVPYESQILHMLSNQGENQLIDDEKNELSLCDISNKQTLTIQLTNRSSFQFYGFHQNLHLSFKDFSEYFIQNQESTQKMIRSCNFGLKNLQQQRFIKHFIMYLYSGIKSHFSIKLIIDKFKALVSTIKYESIWKPNAEDQTLKVNQTFVLAYLMKNADSRLKIQLMKLLSQNLPIPLYLKSYQSIFKPLNEFKLNQELLWILKEGFTITSIGLHSANPEKQTGKSSLLNDIFPVRFQNTENKHEIVKGVPFIALRVFQNIIPLHIIDIPHDFPQVQKQDIISKSNMLMIHSWRSEEQTQSECKNLKEKYGIPVIMLIRDCKEANMKTLKGNLIMSEKPQKVRNLSRKQVLTQEINLLKEEVFKFLKLKIAEKSNTSKIFQLYQANEIYKKFNKLVSNLEKKNVGLTPITNSLEQAKINASKIPQKRNTMSPKMSVELINILQYFLQQEAKDHKNLLLYMLRQKLNTFQNEKNIKFAKIYEHKQYFQQNIKQKQISTQQRRERVKELNKILSQLSQLKPKSIANKPDAIIESIIKQMIDTYENKIKPKIFSIELFWRQLCGQLQLNKDFKVQKQSLLSITKDLKDIQIGSNLPFQIIDGDLLEMPTLLMHQLFHRNEERAVVISILGPQSSGKSTLLNFLFGCDFATSQGRCTRGVYGTYFKFSQNQSYFNNITNCDGIFVLDTQGLFALTNDKDSLNDERKNFDSKLVLFCLAVSDFVVINVRGNFDQNTEKIVRICHERLKDLHIRDQRKPEIIVTLNINPSNKKQESENQFKVIRKVIDFDLHKNLSLAYQSDNYDHKRISLFGKNQILAKKYPLQSFLTETKDLMNEILNKIVKKANIFKLCEIMQNFQRIWSTIVAFPNLSKSVSSEYRKCQKMIKKWKDIHNQEQSFKIKELFQRFKDNKITQQEIEQKIRISEHQLINLYQLQFKELINDDEDIRALKRQERDKIHTKSLATKSGLKYQIDNYRLLERIKRSKTEGDLMLKQKANEIYHQITTKKKNYSDKELQKIFKRSFQEQLQKIQSIINLGDQKVRQFQKIHADYQYLINELSHSEKGLPKFDSNKIELDETEEIDGLLKKLKNAILQPRSKSFEDVLMHTNRIHTNILKGGRTDATLEYFNIKDYFEIRQIKQFYTIKKDHIQQLLDIEAIKERLIELIKESNFQYIMDVEILIILESINKSLKQIGVSLNFNTFKNAIIHQWSKTFGINSQTDGKLTYESFFKSKDISNQKHSHPQCQYLYYGESEDKCICSIKNSNENSNYVQRTLYNHINWKAIIKHIEQRPKYKEYQEKINHKLYEQINKDFDKINLNFSLKVNWNQYIRSLEPTSTNKTEKLNASTNNLKEQTTTQQKIFQALLDSKFIQISVFKKVVQPVSKQTLSQEQVILFIVKSQKYEPIQTNHYFDEYLKENTKLTIKQMKKNQFKMFIFDELKNKKKSLDLLTQNVYKIVSTVIKEWETLEAKALKDIYNKVNQQICKFNDDMNQISCNLSDKYIGYLNLVIVYIIWKLVIDQKLKQKLQVYDEKTKDYDNEWELFKSRVSCDQEKKVLLEIKEFCKQLVNLYKKEIIANKKLDYMEVEERNFKKQYTRQKIQQCLDTQVFSKDYQEQQLLSYLQHPHKLISSKYAEFYQKSWLQLKQKYSVLHLEEQTLREFQISLTQLIPRLRQIGIDQTKKNFSDIFEIVMATKTECGHEVDQVSYQSEGKKILYDYFIDVLLCEEPNKPRVCMNVTVKPKRQLFFKNKISTELQNMLNLLKIFHSLSITNLTKFVQNLSRPQNFQKLTQEVVKIKQMNFADKKNYLTSIKQLICSQKCPCCGRICGVEDEHQYHKCIYGHQMRGLYGTYFERPNNVKQASTSRCEDMAEIDFLDYNGKKYTWCQFKLYWKQKKVGGWLFDDLQSSKDETQLKFQHAWTVAGPIYCKNEGLTFVTHNTVNRSINRPVHCIFVLDQSGSMLGQRWNNLVVSLNAAIDSLRVKDANRKLITISIIKFNQSATLVLQNEPVASKINTLTCSGGTTNLNLALLEAARTAVKYIKTSIIKVILMTDGQAQYPTIGVQTCNKIRSLCPQRFIFNGIQFTQQNHVLKQIARDLKGVSSTAFNPDQLTKLFLKSVEVVQFRENTSKNR